MAGVPIYPTRGRGGGWRLVGGARTDLTGLTEGEVTSLLIGLTQSATAEPERIAAVRKLMRAAPAPFRETAQRVASATVRDVPWGQPDNAQQAQTVAKLQHAIAHQLQVHLEYDGSRGTASVDVVPLVVGSRGAHWYVLAAPVVAGAEIADVQRLRTYRADRISELTELPLAGKAPDGFDSQAEWARMVSRVEDLRGAVHATVHVEPWAVRALCDRFGAQAQVRESNIAAGSRTVVEVRAHRIDALAEQLAGWSAVAEVVGPREVRVALADLGRRIVAQYSEEGDG